MANKIFKDKPPVTEPGKSTRKGINIVIQGTLVTLLLKFGLTAAGVEDQEFWLPILVPIITGLWHTAQKFILHKLGINIQIDMPKILPVLLCSTMLCSCAMVRTSQTDAESSYNSIGLVIGKGEISDLQAAFVQEGVDVDGSYLNTVIGHQSSRIKSENALMIETVVQSAITGAVEAIRAAQGLSAEAAQAGPVVTKAPLPVRVEPAAPPLISIGFGPIEGIE